MQERTFRGSSPAQRRTYNRYVGQGLVHATEVRASFKSTGETLRLRDVVELTGLNKGMCFRLLYTLHHCGFVEKTSGNQYRLVSGVRPNRCFRIGYAGQGQDSSFPREVLAGLLRAAEDAHVGGVAVDNRYAPRVALRNADRLVLEQVHLAIEF